MKITHWILILLLSLVVIDTKAEMEWYNPQKASFATIRGLGWPQEATSDLERLPLRAKQSVRTQVWELAECNAGLSCAFYTDAAEIVIRYQLKTKFSLPHLSQTGGSGIDLYSRDCHGKQYWCAGKISFADTVLYRYEKIDYKNSHNNGNEYRLYLPSYNSIQWIEVGVPKSSQFRWAPLPVDRPIVVYGTSIVQGACASRPGMMWTTILERKLDHPLINLGFSGNAFLEPQIIDLINELDTRLIVLDNIPNLAERPHMDVYSLVTAAVQRIRSQSRTPILLVDHAGYPRGEISDEWKRRYLHPNAEQKRAFEDLLSQGVKELYYLTKQEIAMSLDGTVDGVHPSDWGMQQYADAYEKKIRVILNEPIDTFSTTMPCRQRRDRIYEWNDRHAAVLELNRKNPPEIVMIGNSITHFWSGEPIAPRRDGEKAWNSLFKGREVVNLGFGWDRIENLLWRIYHGELSGYEARSVVLMIGTNNLEINTDQEILAGFRMVMQAIKDRQPRAEIVIVGVLPRRTFEKRIEELNRQICSLAWLMGFGYQDAGTDLLLPRGTIDESLFRDGVHPNENGYKKIAERLKGWLDQ